MQPPKKRPYLSACCRRTNEHLPNTERHKKRQWREPGCRHVFPVKLTVSTPKKRSGIVNQPGGCRGCKVNGKSTVLTLKKAVDLALPVQGQGMIKTIIPQGCSFCVESGQPMCAKSHTQPCHLAHTRQSRMQNRPMAGPDSPTQALARAGRENTRARPAHGLTSDF